MKKSIHVLVDEEIKAQVVQLSKHPEVQSDLQLAEGRRLPGFNAAVIREGLRLGLPQLAENYNIIF